MAIDCEDIIGQALLKYNMDKADVDEFFKAANALYRRINAEAKGAQLTPEVIAAADKYAEKEKLAIIARKRDVQLQLAKQFSVVKFCLNNFAGMEAEGIKALMGGSLFNRADARFSVDMMRSALEGKYRGGFMADLNALGKAHVRLYKKGLLDRQIAEAMWTIDNPNASPFTGPKEAMDIAKVAHKWSEIARTDENTAGAWIGKLPGYIVRQSHDMAKIRKAGAEEWKNAIRDKLDWTSTAEGVFDPAKDADAAEKFLDAVFLDLASGHHMRVPEENVSPLTRVSVLGAVASKASKERVLHFKTGADWFDYNERFGLSNLREAYERGLRNAARNTALMR